MQLGEVKVEGSFEVFDSKGGWAFLLGKLLLCLFNANQEFARDKVTICSAQGSNSTPLHNKITQPGLNNKTMGVNLTLDIKQMAEKEKMNPAKECERNPTCSMEKEQESILTREKDTWKPEHVAQILKEVTIGWDISNTECDIV